MIGDNRIGIWVADVSGHGVPASLITSMVKIAFVSQMSHAADPARVLAGVNHILCGKLESDTPLTLSPPWGSVPAWQEANLSIDFHLKRYYSRLKPAMQIAREARIRLESIFPSLDDLCMMTCPRCPDPCCLSASPWYDFRDLIFLHLNHLSIPLTQTIADLKRPVAI